MKPKNLKYSMSIFLLSILLTNCTKEYDCADLQIHLAFIAYSNSDIDTLVLKKFKPSDSYQTLVDTFLVNYGYSGYYQTSNDTTTVFVTDGINGVKAGFDWQIFIPSKNKTILVSDIMSEKKTGKCGSGIFSMDKFGCHCTNNIYSIKKDNQLISFSKLDASRYVYIHN